jgi:ubiquinone/menaquinone biosynthesis C-methylase UbiE
VPAASAHDDSTALPVRAGAACWPLMSLTCAVDCTQVLRPGGRFMCLEFSHVVLPGLKELYETYSFNVIPQIGRWALHSAHEVVHVFWAGHSWYGTTTNCANRADRFVANDQQSYQYLVESIRQFPPQDEFADMITDAGFAGVKYENLTGGIVAIHSGTKWR